MLGRLRQAGVFPDVKESASPAVAAAHRLADGRPSPPHLPDTVDLQIVKRLLKKTSVLGLLCKPLRQVSVKNAAPDEDGDQPKSIMQKAQNATKLTAEQKRILLQTGSKGKMSRHELLLKIAKHRSKAV